MKILPKYTIRKDCRVCGTKTKKLLDLGETPLADRFVDSIDSPEDFYPLRLSVCPKCFLVQLSVDVDDKELFATDYAFFTSTTSSVKHFQEYAETIKSLYPKQSKGYVLEIGSNDGTLLKEFEGAKVLLGIDPADKPVELALKNGIPTLQVPFSLKVAKQITKGKERADLIMANNVFAHVVDPLGFLKGVKILLNKEGVAVLEFQYSPDLIFKNEFDNVYHEHRSFLSLTSFNYMIKKTGLMIEHVRKVDMQGGSLRVYLRHKGVVKANSSVEKMLSDEESIGMNDIKTYCDLQSRLNYNKYTLLTLLDELRSKGKTIYGYGASAKSNTMLNYYGINDNYLDKIVDKTPFKYNKFSPGSHILVVEQTDADMPDYYLLCVWNYLPQILERETKFIKNGGKFIVPIPYTKVI